MIPPQFIERLIGDSGVDVGTESLDAVFPDGERIRVVLRIGTPYKKNNTDDFFSIRVELENLDRTDGPLSGCSSLGAIATALRFIICRLEIFTERHGCRYVWPDTNEPVDFHLAFSTSK